MELPDSCLTANGTGVPITMPFIIGVIRYVNYICNINRSN
jgi:hypothetical protein